MFESTVWVGLDQSLSNTGVAVINKELNTVITTVFKTKNGDKTLDKLTSICGFMGHICESLDIEEVFLEAVYGGKAAFEVLIRVQAVIQNVINCYGIEQDVISANVRQKNSWPSLLGLEGTKDYCKEWLGERLDIKITTHEVDAIGVLGGSLVRRGIIRRDQLLEAEFIRLSDREFIREIQQRSVILSA